MTQQREAPSGEPRWPRIVIAIVFTLLYPVVVIIFFGLGIVVAYELGEAFSGSAAGSFFQSWIAFFGIAGGLFAVWAYRRTARAAGALLATRVTRVGQASPGRIRTYEDSYRRNPRGPDRRVITLTVWFPADPTDRREHSRELVRINRHFTFYGRDVKGPAALLAKYPIGTPVTVYRGRRGLIVTTDLHRDHLAWYEFW
ncbi:hypothetical protein [Gordonia neofelifaecis]|uniref:DUF3592 domain-containing protein n=1 Tax=Gordonia neofelifaecis NRRL B-59395 TaxID=644548 RepID=F1YM60_9ACTN|nr:hypothetical protein [Gordonia neofelifaecis]EGD54311.1 hypothetical protein SCNU_15021 [Gordonia neofelifaecis NRRL B-59395]